MITPFIMTGCRDTQLAVYSQCVNHEYLASCRVDTPDWRRCDAYCGQQLILEWRLPWEVKRDGDVFIMLYVIYKNHTSETITFPVHNRVGLHVYRLINERYLETGGLLTYRVELCQNKRRLHEWTHHLWTRIILLDELEEDHSK